MIAGDAAVLLPLYRWLDSSKALTGVACCKRKIVFQNK
ncbi:hypothetical protein PRUB_a4260 [Pseudoalteromonas rubra]|uniref:Uncharacterized protein n=1 Tax=Pseudoalteromonas rubra TaxID=43658 RepID=A0A8T0C479_9GAMM|nr:hypothetical protein PRUB_a4260 [Pseudoalteromonas rubra]